MECSRRYLAIRETLFESPVSRAGDIQIERKFDGWKAETFVFPSVLKSRPEDFNFSRYRDFEVGPLRNRCESILIPKPKIPKPCDSEK